VIERRVNLDLFRGLRRCLTRGHAVGRDLHQSREEKLENYGETKGESRVTLKTGPGEALEARGKAESGPSDF